MNCSDSEFVEFVRNFADKLQVAIDDDAIQYLAGCCRLSERIATNLIRWVRDYAEAKSDGYVSLIVAQEAVRMTEQRTGTLPKPGTN